MRFRLWLSALVMLAASMGNIYLTLALIRGRAHLFAWTWEWVVFLSPIVLMILEWAWKKLGKIKDEVETGKLVTGNGFTAAHRLSPAPPPGQVRPPPKR